MTTCSREAILLARAVQRAQLAICSVGLKVGVHVVDQGMGKLPKKLSSSFVALATALSKLLEQVYFEESVSVDV